MTMALLACLAVTGYVALQPDTSEDLAAPRERRGASAPGPQGAPGDRPRAATASAGADRTTAGTQVQDRRNLLAALTAWQASRTQRALPAPDALSRQAWASQQPPLPPPAPAEPTEPAEPVAPPFPYAWVGRYLDPRPRAIIAGPTGAWVKASGDVLEGQWRIDAIDERHMTLTYLPLGQSQTVAMK
ncbi:MAG: hypothetical protein EOP40_02460 [Rubrivivax sp.]|nr:MAG: hypothetical protein EOP40_02460 [Rubrivivax sp.]